MKKVLALLLVVCLGLCSAGCGGGYTTATGSGYSFEVKTKWEKEKYDSETYHYFLNKKNDFPYLSVSEYFQGFPDNSISDQYDTILKYYLADNNYSDGALITKHSNIEKGSLGAYAFVTADREMTTGDWSVYSIELYFFTSPSMMVHFSFRSMEKSDMTKYRKDIDRLFKSVKLI